MSSKSLDYQANSSLSQKISSRAREDINLTIQQAAKLATASHELITHFNDWSNPHETHSSKEDNLSPDDDNFGFKSKNKANKSSSSGNQDWF